jgi:thiol-disulfide isomerase/thioredoxin
MFINYRTSYRSPHIRASLWVLLTALAVGQTAHAVTGEELASQTRKATVGQLAPEGLLTTVDGKTIDLNEFYGHRPVYLKFWATWCVPCREQMPHFQHAFERYKDRVAVVAVNLGLNDDADDVRRYLKQIALPMPVAIDSAGELASAFGVVVTPMHVLIDADGRVVYVGHEAGKELDAALEKLAQSQPQQKSRNAKRPQMAGHGLLKAGDTAPEFSVAIDGTVNRWSLSSSRSGKTTGKPVVISFITSWCESYLKDSKPTASASCRQTRELISRTAAAGNRVNWIVIAERVWSTPADIADYRSRYSVQQSVGMDATGEIFRKYGIREVPTVVIVGADGKIQERFDGFSPQLEAALIRLNGTTP